MSADPNAMLYDALFKLSDRLARKMLPWVSRKPRQAAALAFLPLAVSGACLAFAISGIITTYGAGERFEGAYGLTVIAAMIVSIVSPLASIALLRAYYLAENDPEGDPVRRLRMKSQAVQLAFAEAESLMVDLRNEMDAQHAAYEALVAQTDEQDELLKVGREEAEIIGRYLSAANRKSERRSFRRDLTFFILGLILSTIAGALVNIWT